MRYQSTRAEIIDHLGRVHVQVVFGNGDSTILIVEKLNKYFGRTNYYKNYSRIF